MTKLIRRKRKKKAKINPIGDERAEITINPQNKMRSYHEQLYIVMVNLEKWEAVPIKETG